MMLSSFEQFISLIRLIGKGIIAILRNKKFLLIIGILIILGLGLFWWFFGRPQIPPPYPLIENVTKIEVKENLPVSYKSQFGGASCDGYNFGAKEMDVIATDKSEDDIMNFYTAYAVANGLSRQRSDYGIYDENLVSTHFESRCFAGKFSKPQPAFFFAVVNYNKNAKLINYYFTNIPPNPKFIVFLLRGFITYE